MGFDHLHVEHEAPKLVWSTQTTTSRKDGPDP